MLHILIAPGAFKHSLTAAQASAAIARGLEQAGIETPLVQLPIADGGNGTLEAFLAQGGERAGLAHGREPLMARKLLGKSG